jgi:TonB family protein
MMYRLRLVIVLCTVSFPLLFAQSGPSTEQNQQSSSPSHATQGDATPPQGEPVPCPVPVVIVHNDRDCSQYPSPCVTPPRQVFAPEPELSKEAREAHYEGTGVLGLIIRTDGKVCRVRMLKRIGFGMDEKAVEAAKSWLFEPAVKDGKPVAVEIAVQMNFHLNSIFVSPTSARVVPEGKQQFSATIAGSTSPKVKWSVSCSASACGSISDEGLYTAPSSAPTPVTVTAVSATDPTKTASAKVDIQVNSSK